jgi:endonuclease/exonuclease/phosphatase family metal-dependent hydrolase
VKILTWNCNLNFSRKYKQIEQYDADILIIQECEKLPIDFIAGKKLFWMGKNEAKGLAVIVKGDSSMPLENINNDLIYFLPIQTQYGLIIGSWAFNRRAKKFGLACSGNLADVLEFYKSSISSNSQAIISGDFNNGPRWDLKYFHKNNFRHINSELNKKEFTSAYHFITNEELGTENDCTFFHQRNVKKGFFIDYVYSKGFETLNCEVGTFDNWNIYSDHVPVIAEFKD